MFTCKTASKLTSLVGKGVTVAFLFMLVGCAGSGRLVAESDKDSSGAFDGEWIATVQKTPTPQTVQNWRIRCGDRGGQYTLVVKGGEVSTTVNWESGAKTYSAFINSEGKFVLKYPSGITFKTTISSSVSMADQSAPLIIRGNLAEGKQKGSFVVGLPSLGNSGCTSKATFAKS